MHYREDETREILRRVSMAYGLDVPIRRGFDDGQEYHKDDIREYDENLTDRFDEDYDE